MNKKLKNPVFTFVLFSFIIFIVFLGIIGVMIALGVPDTSTIVTILKNVSAWSSTFAFLILFKRIYPNKTLKEFIKGLFSKRLNVFFIFIILVIQVAIFVITILVFVKVNSEVNSVTEALKYTNFGMIMYWLFFNLSSGPLGEELGWRGFALNELQKKYTVLASALIMGALWGLWHLPLWFLTGFTGMALLEYSIFFFISIVSFSVFLTFFYSKNRNLLIPIIIHLVFNFLTSMINVASEELVTIFLVTAICYTTVAIVLVFTNFKYFTSKNTETQS